MVVLWHLFILQMLSEIKGFDKTRFPNVTPVEPGEMYIKKYLVGAETTYSANNEVTDSAASGTALSSGYKTNNGHVGIDPQAKPHANILEACQYIGKNTGIVCTYEWTNATPTAFSTHDISRANMTVMSEQIVNQGIDVVLGNTHTAFSDKKWFMDSALYERGYKIIKDKDSLKSVKPGDRIWGKLPAAYYDVERAESTPNIAELTEAAIIALNDENENGFFLMVEGSAVDGGGHSNNVVNNVGEYLAFDAACKVAIEFAKSRNDTIVVIAPDHDTGGLYYNYEDLNKIVQDVQFGIRSSFAHYETGAHTARNGGVFMYIPKDVPYPSGIDPTQSSQVDEEFYNSYGKFSSVYPSNPVNVINNIDIVKYITSLINVDLDKISNELYVDVTEQGTYDSASEIFTFKDNDIKIKRNTSTASVHGINIELSGEVALYIEGRFYVPQRIFTLEDQIVDGMVVQADYKTGRIFYSGNIGKQNAQLPVTVAITKPNAIDMEEENILAIDQLTINLNGTFTFEGTVDRLAGNYTIYTNYSDGSDRPLMINFALKNTIPLMTVKRIIQTLPR